MLKSKQKQEQIFAQQRIKELGDEVGVYKNKVRQNCFICGMGLAGTEEEKFQYYLNFGNCCRACSSDAYKKSKTPEGKSHYKIMSELLNFERILV